MIAHWTCNQNGVLRIFVHKQCRVTSSAKQLNKTWWQYYVGENRNRHGGNDFARHSVLVIAVDIVAVVCSWLRSTWRRLAIIQTALIVCLTNCIMDDLITIKMIIIGDYFVHSFSAIVRFSPVSWSIGCISIALGTPAKRIFFDCNRGRWNNSEFFRRRRWRTLLAVAAKLRYVGRIHFVLHCRRNW